MTGLSKLSQRELADALGSAIATRKAAEEAEASYKDELKKRGLTHILGQTFEIKVSASTKPVLDTKAVTEALGEDWVKDHTKIVEFNRVNATILKDVAAAL